MEAFLSEHLSGGWIDASALTALISVILIDIVLAGDNAIVVGMAAAGLPAKERRKVIFWGIMAAAALRIVLSVITTQLLAIIGLLLAGGILLLWVCWRMWRELRPGKQAWELAEPEVERLPLESAPAAVEAEKPRKTFREAVIQVVIADVSMSLDNVLAVAGAAMDHVWVLVIGLTLSVALMGLAATLIARLLDRHRWIAYVGLVIILYIAIKMIVEGTIDVLHATNAM